MKPKDFIHDLISLTLNPKSPKGALVMFTAQDGQKVKGTESTPPAFGTKFGPMVAQLIKEDVIQGAAKTVHVSRTDRDAVVVVGLGAQNQFAPEKARQSGAHAYAKCAAEKFSSVVISADSLISAVGEVHRESALRAFLEGFYLASYTFTKHKSKPGADRALKSVAVLCDHKKFAQELPGILEDVLITIDCIFTTRDFSNEPSNHGTPEYYAKTISTLAKKYGIKCKLLNEKKKKKEGMDLYLSVGNGSDREGYVVVLEVAPQAAAKKSAKKVAFVGKGITFDSGGISLKPGLRMEEMKHDMTGAATLFGSTLLAARRGSPHHLITILAFTENMPSGRATQPGNIIQARNGKTVEIINTDAEGRLILADALDLAGDYKPDVIVDAATLTGACGIALGKFASAVFATDEDAYRAISEASESTEERLWRLPLWDDYIEDLRSATADFMNSANDSFGGTIRGAIFMKQFIPGNTPWVHVDMANTANDLGIYPYNPRKGASGIFVRTFAEFLNRF